MKTSSAGIDLIKRFEGLELKAYQDIAGIWTIGYGHTETAKPGQKITEEEAELFLRADIQSRERFLRGWAFEFDIDLNQNQFDALISFIYNVGKSGFRGSTASRRIVEGNLVGAADALTWWNKATVDGVKREVAGLNRRRAAERTLFLTPIEETTNNPEARGFIPSQDTRCKSVFESGGFLACINGFFS